MRLLQLDASGFEQNAEIKRIDLKIKQDQEQLAFTRSPAEAAALTADIENLQVQAHAIRASMFGLVTAKNEVQITADRDKLHPSIAHKAINQQIAFVNATLRPDEAKKRAIDDATKLVEHQQAIDKVIKDVEATVKAAAAYAAGRCRRACSGRAQ